MLLMESGRPFSCDTIAPGVKVWLSTGGEGAFGRGRWQLLDAIQKRGSLQLAAEELGISYRKAWGDLRKTEHILGVSLLERHRGGRGGGECSLTEEGRRWWKEYARFEREVESYVAVSYARWVKRMTR